MQHKATNADKATALNEILDIVGVSDAINRVGQRYLAEKPYFETYRQVKVAVARLKPPRVIAVSADISTPIEGKTHMSDEKKKWGGARPGAGRPRKTAEEKALHKYVTIGIGVLPEQAAAIRQKATAAGKSIARYLVDCALNPVPQQNEKSPRPTVCRDCGARMHGNGRGICACTRCDMVFDTAAGTWYRWQKLQV